MHRVRASASTVGMRAMRASSSTNLIAAAASSSSASLFLVAASAVSAQAARAMSAGGKKEKGMPRQGTHTHSKCGTAKALHCAIAF